MYTNLDSNAKTFQSGKPTINLLIQCNLDYPDLIYLDVIWPAL